MSSAFKKPKSKSGKTAKKPIKSIKASKAPKAKSRPIAASSKNKKIAPKFKAKPKKARVLPLSNKKKAVRASKKIKSKKIIKKIIPKSNKTASKKGVQAKQIKPEPKIIPPKPKTLSKEMQELLTRPQTRHWLVELGGENAIEVVKSLPSIPNDEDLAKKLKIKVSDVRASLNKLHNEGLVTYVRDKNSETGWYSYAWVINEDRIRRWLDLRYASQEEFAPREGTVFYFCKGCGLDSAVTFAVASECLFRCQECNSALDFLDNDKFEQYRKVKEAER